MTIRIFKKQAKCSVLGPGIRSVIWVQGCGFRCKGCLVPESWSERGGEEVEIESLVRWIQAQAGINGLTFSGGEPFNQAAALRELVRAVRVVRPELSFMSYTGYEHRWLFSHGTEEQRELLESLDILVDGPYRQELHADLLWRGSVNQKIHLLTRRYEGKLPKVDKGQGLELEFSGKGTFTFSGVPPWPGYAKELRKEFARV